MGRLSRSAAITGAVALVLGGAGAAYGLTRGGGTITVCVKHRGGVLYQASRCASGDKKLSWGAAGARGPQGPQGQQGATGATGAAGSQGQKGDTGAQGIQGVQGIQGIQGIPGVVGALSDLDGVGCTVPEGSDPGTVTVSTSDAGAASIACVATLGTTNVGTPDGLHTSFANPENLGTVPCGGFGSFNGTVSPSGDEDWFEVTTTTCANGFAIDLTPDTGIAMDLVDSKGNETETSTSQFTEPDGSTGTYEFVVYGGPRVIGHYSLSLDHSVP